MTVKSKNQGQAVGRPRTARADIVAATVALLRERGAQLSLEDVAEAIGVRRQTIYNHFGSKDALLREAILAIRDELVIPFEVIEGPPPAVLRAVAEAVTAHLLDPDDLRLRIMLRASAYDNPAIVEWLRPRETRPFSQALAAYLATCAAGGSLSVSDPQAAAELFLGALTGFDLARAMAGDAAPDAVWRERRVTGAVATFLRAWGYRPDDRP